MTERLKIGLISVSDRASTGIYEDKGIPALKAWLESAIIEPFDVIDKIIPDDQTEIEKTLINFVDDRACHLIFTTGGTGPAKRDVTPDATLNVADKIMQGFGERMRQISLNFVPTAILSRQEAVIRKQCLIVNLPGQPKSIKEILEGIKHDDHKSNVTGIFASIPYCIQLLDGPYFTTKSDVIESFRPKSAIKDKSEQGN